jgi:hypothetical protein
MGKCSSALVTAWNRPAPCPSKLRLRPRMALRMPRGYTMFGQSRIVRLSYDVQWEFPTRYWRLNYSDPITMEIDDQRSPSTAFGCHSQVTTIIISQTQFHGKSHLDGGEGLCFFIIEDEQGVRSAKQIMSPSFVTGTDSYW